MPQDWKARMRVLSPIHSRERALQLIGLVLLMFRLENLIVCVRAVPLLIWLLPRWHTPADHTLTATPLRSPPRLTYSKYHDIQNIITWQEEIL